MLIGEGAEAKIYKTRIFGNEVIVKRREKKAYRVSELDQRLRRERTSSEARIMLRLHRSGVKTPRIIAVGRFSIYMERLHGRALKDIEVTQKHMGEVGRTLGRIHGLNVAHGDFTPANLMLCKDGLYVMDFGLAEATNSTEEKALDILLMKRSVPKALYSAFIVSYSKAFGKAAETKKRLGEIEKRGRYQIRTLA